MKTEAVRIRLFGSFKVSVGSRTIEGDVWRLKKAAALVKLLALGPDHRLHREQVMDLLWPDAGRKAGSNNLRQAIHAARKALDPEQGSRYLASQDQLLSLCPEGNLWVDAEAFEGAAWAARRTKEPSAYETALELYAGELLPQDRYEGWAEERRRELRQTYLSLLIGLASIHEGREDYGSAVEVLQKVTREEPTKEDAQVRLMRLYALSGQKAEALRQYELIEETTSRELGAGPSVSTRALREEIASGRFPPEVTRPFAPPSKEVSEPPQHNLPVPRSSFVGRRHELTEIKRTLAMTRLLTMTGAGGCGKTRLALKVATGLEALYPDGVWLVELAGLSEPELVPQAVAEALGAREQPGRPLVETVAAYLRDKKMLLVLDNCEHLIDATAHLVDFLLASCPHLKVLATSREPLGVEGEVLFSVPPLSVPAELPTDTSKIEDHDSVQLFVERTRMRLPDFSLTQENAAAAAEVCRKLEGLPLAIELAAARMGTLATEQVAQRLGDSLALLSAGPRTASPRHRTMRAAIEWSHGLLSEGEKEMFARLCVFASGFTLEAAEAVCSGGAIEESEVLDLLSGLVNKSLVVAEATGEGRVRYRMLEPVRQYGLERLKKSGQTEQTRESHARYYLEVVEAAEPELMGPRPVECLERLELEQDNLRAALSWSLDADAESEDRTEVGLRLAAALGRFWDAHSPSEVRRWLEKGLQRSRVAPASVRAKALNEAGFIAVYELDPRGMALLEEALASYKELGDRSGMALSISNMGHAVIHLRDRERMVSLRQEVQALFSEPLEGRVRAHLLFFLAFAAGSEMDFEQMKVRLEEASSLFREAEDIRNLATCLLSIGQILLIQGDCERAAPLFEEGMLLQKDLKHKTVIHYGLGGMAGVAALRGQAARTAKLMGATEALREEIGLSVGPETSPYYDYERYLNAARARLSEAAFDAAWSEGRAMSAQQAVEYALSEEDTSPRAVPEPHVAPLQSLTPREGEIAALISRGLTNRQIATDLSISEYTVANHVAKILRKLGLSSRSQITAWVVEQRLLQ